MKAVWRGRVVADSEQTLEVDGYRYFPRAAVRMDMLRATPKTDDDRECPHGVQFYDVTIEGRRFERAAWIYEAPRPAMRHVANRIGFWNDVEVG